MTLFPLLRLVGWIEALSFIALLGIAVPVKHAMGNELLVQIVGPIHGALFIGFAVIVAIALVDGRITKGLAARCLIGALLPFGPLLYDKAIKEVEAAEAKAPAVEVS